jgi:AcrR family transcriptional regulator
LEASSKLLIDDGLMSFNTNAVAHASGVNISTLYRYFPDKNAILLELYAIRLELGESYVAQRMDEFSNCDDLGAFNSSIVRELVAAQEINPIGPILHQIFQLLPELKSGEIEYVRTLVALCAEGIQNRFANIALERCEAAASSIFIAVLAMLNATRDEAFEDVDAIAQETISMLTAYLEHLDRENRLSDSS